jgi:hypothetical protein
MRPRGNFGGLMVYVSMLAPAITAGDASERGKSADRHDDQKRVERESITAVRMGRAMQADDPNCGQDQRDHRFHISSIDADRGHGKEENRKQEGRTCFCATVIFGPGHGVNRRPNRSTLARNQVSGLSTTYFMADCIIARSCAT